MPDFPSQSTYDNVRYQMCWDKIYLWGKTREAAIRPNKNCLSKRHRGSLLPATPSEETHKAGGISENRQNRQFMPDAAPA
jgi:hypothetical protein